MKQVAKVDHQTANSYMDNIIHPTISHMLNIAHVILCSKNEIKLLRFFEIDIEKQKKYMRNLSLMIGNDVITDNLSDSIVFREELALYDRNDDTNNRFFRIATRTVNGTESKTLSYKTTTNTIYLSRSEARAIVSIWNMALQGYSFSRMLEYPAEVTHELCVEMMMQCGYLS